MRKILYIFIIGLFLTAGFFGGMVYVTIQQSQLALQQWGQDCVRIDNQMPLMQENYDAQGVLIGKETLEPGYHNYCK
jgi:hypothetical protein